MLSSVSRENPLAAGMRVDGQSQKMGGRMVTSKTTASDTAGTPRNKSVSENFKSALVSRLERFQQSGQSGSKSPEEARALADSLASAAAEVKDVYGQKAANKFMADILKNVDEKGLTADSLTTSISGALKDVAQAGTKAQFNQITESFNRDLGDTGEDDVQGRSVKGLSRAMNDFFEVEGRETDKGIVTQGFNSYGNWGEMTVEESESSNAFMAGTPEAAEQALESSSTFAVKTLGPDTKNDLVDFLRNEVGASEAADFLESAPENADFMSTMDKVIGLALGEIKDDGDVAKLEQYLNDQVKTAINASSEINKNPFGEVEFEGWSIKKGAVNAEGESEPTFESTWRYTNRDDVVFTRTGQAAKKPEAAGQAQAEEEEESTGSSLGDLVKKIAGRNQNKTGELVDTQA